MIGFKENVVRTDKAIFVGSLLLLLSLVLVALALALGIGNVGKMFSYAHALVVPGLFCVVLLVSLLFIKPVSTSRKLLLLTAAVAMAFYFYATLFVSMDVDRAFYVILGACLLAVGIVLTVPMLISLRSRE